MLRLQAQAELLIFCWHTAVLIGVLLPSVDQWDNVDQLAGRHLQMMQIKQNVEKNCSVADSTGYL